MALIEVRNLTKSFKREKRKPGLWGAVQGLFHREFEMKIAVDQLSFNINEGEILGFIGPNGAGKSTTIKMMVGILVPTFGEIKINGSIPYEDRIENAKQIGVVFGQRTQLWWDIPLRESFTLLRYIYKIPEVQFRERMKRFSEVLALDEIINIPVRQLSLGQRMRADLCAALLHNPKILFLDEPTIGLDVVVKENIREFIKEINRNYNTTIILTTHDISDIEKLCSRVLVVDNGRIMYDGNLSQLKSIYGTSEELIMDMEEPVNEITALQDLKQVEVICTGKKVVIKYNTEYINSTLILQKIINSNRVKDFVVRETKIEDIIRKMYKNQLEN